MMYLLAETFPFIRRLRLPFSRDQFMLLLAAVNEIILGVDIYLAHNMNGNIHGYEWIPVIFGPVAGVLLLVAGLVALRRRPLANLIATIIFFASLLVGLLGTWFHLHRALLVNAPPGQVVTAAVLLWAPPLVGPLTFCLVALLGISAAWQEDPVDSGVLTLLGNRKLNMPLPKTRAYFLLTALFILATLLSSVLDHARTNFANPWLWAPTFIGVFAVAVTLAMGAFSHLQRADLLTYVAAMLLMMAVGLLGAVLHTIHNLGDLGTFLDERFLRGAPMLAPLLFANMGLLGLIVLLDPQPK
jgi:hypothetical protein